MGWLGVATGCGAGQQLLGLLGRRVLSRRPCVAAGPRLDPAPTRPPTLTPIRPLRPSSERGVVFGSGPHSFRRWLYKWLRQMIDSTAGPLRPAFEAVTGGGPRAAWACQAPCTPACPAWRCPGVPLLQLQALHPPTHKHAPHHHTTPPAGVLHFDLPLMSFLLPYVVHNVLAAGSEAARAALLEEIRAVVAAAGGGGASGRPGGAPPGGEVAELELYLQVGAGLGWVGLGWLGWGGGGRWVVVCVAVVRAAALVR